MSRRRFVAGRPRRSGSKLMGLPVAFTDPGCELPTHTRGVMDASLAWSGGRRPAQPQLLLCGCQLWLAEKAESLAGLGPIDE